MSKSQREHDLLTAVMAVRLSVLSVAEGASMLRFRAGDPVSTLARIAFERGLIDAAEERLLEATLARRLERVGHDVQELLASLINAECRHMIAMVLEPNLMAPAPGDENLGEEDPTRPILIPPHVNGRSHETPANADPARAVGLSKGPGGDFEILRPLAKGGLGEIHVARDRGLNRDVALKRIHKLYAADSRTLARFLLEAEITGGLEHPGIVPVYAMGWDREGRPYYAMRLIQGETFKERIRAYHKNKSASRPNQRLEFRQLLNQFTRICEVTAYAHSRGVLHRDLKPSNVMIGRYGETLVVDWGLAKSIAEGDLGKLDPAAPDEPRLAPISGSGLQATLHGSAIGTPQYMSPEQARGELDRVGPASDVYSLGATLYHLLAGRAPLAQETDLGVVLSRVGRGEIEPPSAVARGIPRVLESICLKAMALRPENRHPSAADLAADIEHYLADLAVAGVKESLSDRLGRWERRHRALIRVSGAALAVVALTAVLAAFNVDAARQRAEERRQQAVELSRIAAVHKQQADEKRDELKRLTTRLVFDRGLDVLARDERRQGLLWLGRALEDAGPGGGPLETCIRANIAAWRPTIPVLRECFEHPGAARAVAFSPTGRVFATAGDDGVARVWDRATLARRGAPIEHAGPIRSLAFSSDDKTLATGADDQTVRIWDMASERVRATLAIPHGPVVAVAFAQGGRSLVVASADGSCQAFDVAAAQTQGEPFNLGVHPTAIAVAPQGDVAVAGESGALHLWNPSTGKSLRLIGHDETLNCVAFSPDGTLLASAGEDRHPRLWRVTTGERIADNSKQQHASGIESLAFSPDGTKLLTGGYDTSCRIWSVPSLAILNGRMRHGGQVWGLAFDPTGATLAAAVEDNTVQLWDMTTYDRISDPLPHRGPVRAVAFSPDGRSILTGSEDGEARLWTLGRDSGVGLPMVHTDQVRGLLARPDGQAIATSTCDGVLWLWDARTARLIARRSAHEPGFTIEIAFNPAGTLLVSADRSGLIRIWDAASLEPIGELIHMGAWVRKIAISADDTLAAGDHAGNLGLWDARTGKPRAPRQALPHTLTALAFSPDGTRLVVCDSKGEARIWDALRFKPIGRSMRHKGAIHAAVFSPDGARLATGGDDKTARIWDAQTQTPLSDPLPHRAFVWTLQFRPDGERLLTGSFDGFVRVWNGRDGRPAGEWLRQGDLVYGARYDQTGDRILTFGRAHSARLWDAAVTRPLGERLDHGDEIDGAVFIPGQPVVATASRDRTVRLWSIPTPASEPTERLVKRLEVETGMRLDEADRIRVLDVASWRARRQALAETASPLAP